MRVLATVSLTLAACAVNAYEARLSDSDSVVVMSRSADESDELGTCELCPWGDIGTFSTQGVVLTKKQWMNVIDQLGADWCADRRCTDCGSGQQATCEYDSHTFGSVAADGTSATAKMYCDCPLW